MASSNQSSGRARAGNPAVNLLFVAIICLAVGVSIGYYFGRTAGSEPAPAVATGGPAPAQAPGMDPALFLAKESALKASLSTNPKDFNTLAELGNLYYDNQKFQLAIDSYGKALEVNPKDVNIRTDMGSCYWSLGQADPAIREFNKSLESDPSHPQTLFNLGIVYLHGKNDMAEARKAWEKLLATNPNYPQRARIEQMLASMQSPPEAGPGMTPGAGQTQAPKGGAPSMEEMLKKMKK